MPALDADPRASLEESLKTFVPEALDQSCDRIASLYGLHWGFGVMPEFQTWAWLLTPDLRRQEHGHNPATQLAMDQTVSECPLT